MAGNWGGAASGALTGAGLGAKFGSVIPGVGTAIGAGAGGLIGGIGGYFSGNSDEERQIANKTPEQQSALDQILSNLQGMGGQGGNYQAAQNYLGKLLSRDPSVYDQFAAPYMQQFEQQTIPMLSERFAGLGGGLGGGALGSSGFGQAIGGAANNFQTNLAGMFANLQRGAAGDVTNQYNQLANLGLGTQAFQPTYQPGDTGIFGGIAKGLGEAGGKYVGNSLMETLSDYIKNNAKTGIE